LDLVLLCIIIYNRLKGRGIQNVSKAIVMLKFNLHPRLQGSKQIRLFASQISGHTKVFDIWSLLISNPGKAGEEKAAEKLRLSWL